MTPWLPVVSVFAAERNPSGQPARASITHQAGRSRLAALPARTQSESEESQVPQPLGEGERSTVSKQMVSRYKVVKIARSTRSTSARSPRKESHRGPVYRLSTDSAASSSTYLPPKQYYSVVLPTTDSRLGDTTPLIYSDAISAMGHPGVFVRLRSILSTIGVNGALRKPTLEVTFRFL